MAVGIPLISIQMGAPGASNVVLPGEIGLLVREHSPCLSTECPLGELEDTALRLLGEGNAIICREGDSPPIDRRFEGDHGSLGDSPRGELQVRAKLRLLGVRGISFSCISASAAYLHIVAYEHAHILRQVSQQGARKNAALRYARCESAKRGMCMRNALSSGAPCGYQLQVMHLCPANSLDIQCILHQVPLS